MEEVSFADNLSIITYNPETHCHVTLPRWLASYLFGGDDPKAFFTWVEMAINDEPKDFAQHCLEWGQPVLFPDAKYQDEE